MSSGTSRPVMDLTGKLVDIGGRATNLIPEIHMHGLHPPFLVAPGPPDGWARVTHRSTLHVVCVLLLIALTIDEARRSSARLSSRRFFDPLRALPRPAFDYTPFDTSGPIVHRLAA